MPYYITAHYADGSPILGTMDGQNVIRAKRPERTQAWQLLGTGRKFPRVREWKLETDRGQVLAVKLNPHFTQTEN